MKNEDMAHTNTLKASRRAFLQTFSKAVGSVAAASLLAGSGLSVALAYTPKPDSASRNGLIFSKAQMQVLRDICQTIIPRTDTAGAADVDCHGFVDHQLLQCHTPSQQKQCISIVDHVQKMAISAGRPFTASSNTQKEKILTDIEALNGASAQQKADFKFLKALIAFGYFTSQEGATKTLNYQAYPGGYTGSVRVDANTKVYGSLDYY